MKRPSIAQPTPCICVCSQAARVYTDRWVGIWFGDKHNQSLGFYLGIYAGLAVFYSLTTFAR